MAQTSNIHTFWIPAQNLLERLRHVSKSFVKFSTATNARASRKSTTGIATANRKRFQNLRAGGCNAFGKSEVISVVVVQNKTAKVSRWRMPFTHTSATLPKTMGLCISKDVLSKPAALLCTSKQQTTSKWCRVLKEDFTMTVCLGLVAAEPKRLSHPSNTMALCGSK